MIKTMLNAIGLLFMLQTSSIAKDMFLKCNLKPANGDETEYTFHFDPIAKKLHWAEGNIDLKVIQSSKTIIVATHNFRFHTGFEYDETDFRLNRITGAAEIDYDRKPTENETKDCQEKLPKPKGKEHTWCEDYIVLTQHTENGVCALTERAIQ